MTLKEILIVDDEPHVQRILKLSLERAGYKVHCAYNGEDALNYIRTSHPDVLFSDIDMPRMNGRELCRKICEEIPDRKFPIFIFTGRTELEHREWTAITPNLEFFEKPVSVRRVLSRLSDLFEQSG